MYCIVIVILIFHYFLSDTSHKIFCSFFFLTDENRCLKANAKSCGECIQAGPNCGWCTNSVSKVARVLSICSLVIQCGSVLYPSEAHINFYVNHKMNNLMVWSYVVQHSSHQADVAIEHFCTNQNCCKFQRYTRFQRLSIK